MRVRLLVAYDGTDFHGFAPQPDVPTVAGTLADAISTIAQTPVELTCAGRTDAGVHARGQVVHVDLPSPVDVARLAPALNKLCGPSIVVRDAAVVDGSFDARRSAVARVYRYRVHTAPVPDPFSARYAWHVSRPLDLRAMILACDPLFGEHDFSSFCRRPTPVEGVDASLSRRVDDARWCDDGDDMLSFWIEANAFCHQMVRSIVGLMVDVGVGRRRAGEVRGIMQARDRHATGDIAPPHGLCLWEVRY